MRKTQQDVPVEFRLLPTLVVAFIFYKVVIRGAVVRWAVKGSHGRVLPRPEAVALTCVICLVVLVRAWSGCDINAELRDLGERVRHPGRIKTLFANDAKDEDKEKK